MKHTLNLLSAFLKVNVQMSLAYRADTVVNILLNLMWLGWELLSLSIIFSNTETIAGWSFGQLIALLGVFRLVHTYGMNFEHMPELGWRWGYPAAVASMVVIDLYLVYRFRKVGWF